MPGKRHKHPKLLRRVATAIAKQHGGDMSKGFAIATASLQRGGHLKPGTQRLTKKGGKQSRKHAKDAEKESEYEDLLKSAREKRAAHEAINALANLVEGRPSKAERMASMESNLDDPAAHRVYGEFELSGSMAERVEEIAWNSGYEAAMRGGSATMPTKGTAQWTELVWYARQIKALAKMKASWADGYKTGL